MQVGDVQMTKEWLPQEMPSAAVIWISRLLQRLDDERMRPYGVTSAQLPVLVALKNGERLTQKELARIAGVEQPSMAQLLARMERDDLVRREPSPSDGRSSLIMLTEKALATLEPGRDALRSVDADVCAGFTDEERKVFLGLLRRMASNAEAALAQNI